MYGNDVWGCLQCDKVELRLYGTWKYTVGLSVARKCCDGISALWERWLGDNKIPITMVLVRAVMYGAQDGGCVV